MGGVCLTQAIHAHDMLSYINGPVKRVFARLATRVNAIEVEDFDAVVRRRQESPHEQRVGICD